MKRRAWQGGLSLFELIVALALLGGVLLMTVTVRFNFQWLLNMGMNQATLFLNTHLALNRVISAIQSANYLEIDAANNALIISKKVGENYIRSSYSLSNGNLYYQPDLSQAPLPSPEIVLQSVTGFQLTGFPTGGTRFQGARVCLEAEDPQGIAHRDAAFQTAAYCRIFHGSYKPVRVVTRDASGHVLTVKGSYDTIQEAINAKTTEHGDVVQVSSNDKTPYVENVKISKALIFEGGYDSIHWERHYADPDNPGQIHEDYETIVNSKNPTYGTIFSGNAAYLPENGNVVIDGFTISSAAKGVYFSGERTMSLKVSNNKISVTGGAVSFVQGSGVSIDVTGNIVGNKEVSGTAGLASLTQTHGTFLIKDNRLENAGRYGFFWPVSLIQCQGSLTIINNKFSQLSGKSANPGKLLGELAVIYISQHESGDILTIANNSFENLSGGTGAFGTVLHLSQSHFTEVVFKNNLARNCINQAGFNYVEISQSSSFADFTFQNNRIVGIASYSNGRVLSFSQSYFDGPLRVNNNDMSYVNGVIYLSAAKWTKDGLEMTNNTAVRGTTAGSGTGVSLNFSKEYAPSLYRNYIHGFSTGLYASGTFSNAISNNVFANNTEYGVYFINAGSSYSDTPTFSNNVVFGSKIGFYGISLYSGDNRIINSVFWGNQKDFDFLGVKGV
ncbi:MAG TPA: right-handed parallel beta-helix repeat-containing protein, partial [Candidatus Omnitrophota bacterium]|nr:right-handed parallel beta-helix repeat-containing protein [Candidatus Omnitrophota bacterium]